MEAIETFPMLDIDEDAKALAQTILLKGGIPEAYPEDALHIAVAAVHGIEATVTWNFVHMSNPFTRRTIRRIVEDEGYACPEICSPEELLEADK
ncbi:MAG: hypothetical protein AB1634_05695 [Thermodesulfobacteriota bacterium]